MFLFFVKSSPDNLDHLLQSWSKVPAASGRLASPVWQRIESSGGRATWFGRLAMAVYDLDARLARPRAIAAVVIAGLMIGVGVAELRTLHDARRIDTEMSARYLSMLDTSNR